MPGLEFGITYHIYNQGNNKAKIFHGETDFRHFLSLTKKYLLSIADIYCYALMRNHFHFLLRIKKQGEIGFLNPSFRNDKDKKWVTISASEAKSLNIPDEKLQKPNPSKQFAHLFNAYSKWFNLKYSRSGSLFKKNFQRKEVDNKDYLRQLIYYIHHNPIHHKISSDYQSYKWTSYQHYFSSEINFINRSTVVEWFDDLDNFIFFHEEELNLSLINDYILD